MHGRILGRFEKMARTLAGRIAAGIFDFDETTWLGAHSTMSITAPSAWGDYGEAEAVTSSATRPWSRPSTNPARTEPHHRRDGALKAVALQANYPGRVNETGGSNPRDLPRLGPKPPSSIPPSRRIMPCSTWELAATDTGATSAGPTLATNTRVMYRFGEGFGASGRALLPGMDPQGVSGNLPGGAYLAGLCPAHRPTARSRLGLLPAFLACSGSPRSCRASYKGRGLDAMPRRKNRPPSPAPRRQGDGDSRLVEYVEEKSRVTGGARSLPRPPMAGGSASLIGALLTLDDDSSSNTEPHSLREARRRRSRKDVPHHTKIVEKGPRVQSTWLLLPTFETRPCGPSLGEVDARVREPMSAATPVGDHVAGGFYEDAQLELRLPAKNPSPTRRSKGTIEASLPTGQALGVDHGTWMGCGCDRCLGRR